MKERTDMRKLITVVALLALALPAAALAEKGGPKKNEDGQPPAAQNEAQNHEPTASQTCKAHRLSMGMPHFKALYGTNLNKSNALGKCIAKIATAKRVAVSNAAKTCKAERALSDEEFKRALGTDKTFAVYYGSGENGKNALGKCVSSKAKENLADTVEKVTKAAKTCKAEKKMKVADFQAAHAGKTFGQHYGTNLRKTNAFGKCVAAAVKKQNENTETADSGSTETNE